MKNRLKIDSKSQKNIIFSGASGTSEQLENGIITVISESQLQEHGTTYEYIPLQTEPRDALQAALESAEVDKMELLRAADGTVIYENSDSNPQNQTQVSNVPFPTQKMRFSAFASRP